MTAEPANNDAPLKGLRVLELSRILAGPWAGQTLADLGADVIKVESPKGDDTRQWGPPFFENSDGSQDAAYFHACNRGKRGTVIDFSSEQGQGVIHELVKNADVLIENFKVGGLKKYNLDYQSLNKLNPKLIYCSITGFGQHGPYAGRAGYDFIIQGMSGVMDLTGEPDGTPQKMGVAFADVFTGLYAVIAIQAALAKRDVSGRGDHIDMSLMDCMVGVLANQNMNFLATGISPTRQGNSHPNIAPYETFATEDEWFILAIGNDSQFKKFCAIVGLDTVALDSKFSSNAARVEHRAELRALIENKTKKWKRNALLEALEADSVPAAPINSVEQALNDPHIVARGMVTELVRQSDGLVFPSVKTPIQYLNTKLEVQSPSPKLGDDDLTWR